MIESGKFPIIGGFIGKTIYGRKTTYERGGSDRTKVDLEILLYRNYELTVNFEKDFILISANPNVTMITKYELDSDKNKNKEK